MGHVFHSLETGPACAGSPGLRAALPVTVLLISPSLLLRQLAPLSSHSAETSLSAALLCM